ncbi:MAG: hypothetical protein HOA17_08380 [Candidatus Melainabacteria bacterium]|jgi:spore germination protein GerM|nr:hypothetical protein [Candidatus Melainabacteria bacterium]
MSFLRILSILAIFCTVFVTNACSRNQTGLGSVISGPKVTIYFTKASDELGVVLIPVVRKIPKGKTAYEVAIQQLFLGPNEAEQAKQELNTEVPEGSRLIDVEENSKEVKIDISARFINGGGSETMQVRFRQLRETALTLAKGRPVYLYIDGAKAKMLGGEGIEVPQPLDKELD